MRGVPLVSAAEGHPALAELTDAEVYAALRTSPAGLGAEEVASRLAAFGPNELPHISRIPIWLRLGRQFTDFFAIVLLCASAITLVAFLIGRDVGDLQLSAAILGVVVLNAAIGFGQEYMAERTAEALKAMVPERSRVVRDRLHMEVAAAQLVPGDVLILEAGDSAPPLVLASFMRNDSPSVTTSTAWWRMRSIIEDGGLVGQEVAPLVEGPVTGEAQAASLIGGENEAEEELTSGRVGRSEAELVEDDRVDPKQAVDDPADRVVGHIAVERLDQVRGGEVANAQAGLHRCVTDPNQKV